MSNTSTPTYTFTGLHAAHGECTQCEGTGICAECGLLPEGTDCGLCGRNTPKYACEACWPTPCDECGGNEHALIVGLVCTKCGAKGAPQVTRVFTPADDSGACADCGGNGYGVNEHMPKGCTTCGRVWALADMSLVACQGCGAVWTVGHGNGPVDTTEASEWWHAKQCPDCGGA